MVIFSLFTENFPLFSDSISSSFLCDVFRTHDGDSSPSLSLLLYRVIWDLLNDDDSLHFSYTRFSLFSPHPFFARLSQLFFSLSVVAWAIEKKSPSESCTQVETEKLTRWSDVIIRKKDDLSNFCGKKSRYFCMLDCLTISWWLGAMWLTDSLAHVREPRSFGGKSPFQERECRLFDWLVDSVYTKNWFLSDDEFFSLFSLSPSFHSRPERSCGKRWICLDWPITAINNEHDVSVSFSSACYIRFVFNRHRHHHHPAIGCYFWENPVERYLKCHGM